MNQQVKDVVRYWIPELIVVLTLGAVVGATMRMAGFSRLETMLTALCLYVIFGKLLSDGVRKILTPKPKKNDT